jgi:hypothetical protein
MVYIELTDRKSIAKAAPKADTSVSAPAEAAPAAEAPKAEAPAAT